MMKDKNQKALGIFLIVIGVLFLLVSNNFLWFGWGAIWPIYPLLTGLFLLRVYVTRKKPRQLFLGSFLTQLGIFFFLFTSGILSWEAMDALWPAFPLMIGISLLAISGVSEVSALVVGVGFVIFALASFLSDRIPARMSQPVERLWPLVLIGAGVLIILRTRREARERAAAVSGQAGARRETAEEEPQTQA